MRAVGLGLILLMAMGAAPPAERLLAAPTTAQQFFQGRTESRGEIHQLFSTPHSVLSKGTGHMESDGTLVLNQIVNETGVAPKLRAWRLREDRAGHCTGTVTDGIGLVDGSQTGNQLHLRFKLKGGLKVEQFLTIAPNGRSANNRITVRKLGFSVASIDETIRKTD